ncbi:MAG: hypothetical protein LQ343_007152 [Gyalolechia ehrenbergii]|nr:MAG: hypothetical protein LQ343_007152 [Gyalolechia ehrenbergii]
MHSIKNVLVALAFAAAVSAQAGQQADGQVTANSATVAPVTQIGDGQIQQPTSSSTVAPVTQINDGQIQQPTSVATVAPVSQISDGQIQAPPATTVAPVSQISDGQIQAPPATTVAPVNQISDGQIQAPTGASSGVPSPSANGTFTTGAPAAPFTGGAALVTFSGAAVGLAALAENFAEGAPRLMSNNRLGREAHNETSNLSLGNSEHLQPQSDVARQNTDPDRDLENVNGFSDAMISPTKDSSSKVTKAGSSSDAQADVTYPDGGWPAWLIVLGSFSGMLASFGLMNTIGTFQAYLITHQLADESPSAVGGVGTSLIFSPAVGAIAHFFSRYRGAATGLAATGGSFGGIIFPLALQSLFPRLGFAWSVRLLALIFLILLAVANLLIRTRLPPRVGGTVWPDFRIFGNPTFALTTAGVFFLEWGLFVPLSYISSYALANDVSPAFSYQLLAVLNAGSVFGRGIPGYVADRLGRFNTMIAAVALCLISVLGIWLNVGSSVAGLCVFAVLFGFASGSNISLTPVCVGQLCEPDVFGRWYGTLYTVVSIGCLTGIPIAGEILSVSNEDYWGLIIFTGMSYAGGLICFTAARVLNVGWSLKAIY